MPSRDKPADDTILIDRPRIINRHEAMSSSTDPSREAPPPKATASTDPILRNALRYTVSADEYATLHKYILSRSRALRRVAPSPGGVDRALRPRKGRDDYNARAVRHALRVFAATWLGMKGWDTVERRMKNKE